jgi:hypothetical protein
MGVKRHHEVQVKTPTRKLATSGLRLANPLVAAVAALLGRMQLSGQAGPLEQLGLGSGLGDQELCGDKLSIEIVGGNQLVVGADSPYPAGLHN